MPVSLRPLLSHLPLVAAVLALAAAGTPAGAQANNTASSIYTCVDAQGRRLTSDRPILACLDREQRELSSTGILRRVIPPGLTATEREAREAREREAYVERQRARDTIRRDQALITRYPDKATHDAGRKEALAQTQAVVDTAERRIAELAAERRTLDDEMEFYRKDPSRAPAKLRRAIESNAQEVEEQRRAIAGQQDERNRINARFDDEAQRLQPLWQAAAAQAAKTPASPTQR
ncbi:DUF4124 domain-containing protein [Ottowia sp.]|uniref:DUF4124 domain-containing protein n=1 Tax=Ottowia sp. TaxID=1898956 RepID=UPI0039E4FED6